MSAKLLEKPKMKYTDRGKKSKHPKIEKTLSDLVQESRQDGYIVTRGAIHLQALKLSKKTGVAEYG